MFRKKQTPANPPRNVQRSQQSTVFSYHASRSPSESPVRRSPQADTAKSSRLRINRSWLGYTPSLLAGIALVVCMVYVATLDTSPKIQSVSGRHGKTLVQNASSYEDEAAEILARSILNRSKLLIDTDKVAEDLRAAFPELGDISVVVPLVSRRPIIEVRPTQPALIAASSEGAFIVDTEGRVLAKANEVDSSIRDPLPIVRDESGLSIEQGKILLPKETVSFIREVAGQLQAGKIEVESLTLPAVVNELHVRVAGKAYYVKFDIRGEGRGQAGTYLAVKERLEKDNKTPAEYIDVRVSEKAFYK